MNEGSLLIVDSVHKSFASPGAGAEIQVLRGVDLAVAAGETLAIVGPSGSGKSTLLSLMGGLDEPTRGRVVLDGCDLSTLCEGERARVRNRRIGFVFQFHHLLPQCTVWENVLVPTLAFRHARGSGAADAAAARAGSLIERVGLGGRLDHRPAELSGGECLRVAVARALVNRPDLLLADEPTGSLDADSAASLAQLLVELNREQGVSLVVVTHSAFLADLMGRRCLLRRGVLEA